jgi:hypothetical protein
MGIGIGRSIVFTVLSLASLAAPAAAQLEDNLSSLSGDLAQGYLGPLSKGLSATLNSGIFRSGDVPAAGVELTLDLRASYISFADEDRLYTATTAGFETIEAPTVIGDTQARAADHETLGSAVQFTYPGGFDMKNFGIAVPQLTVGSVLGTRAIVRWISLQLGSDEDDLGDFSLFGIGGQHSITRYFPGLPLDLAFGGMWQRFTIGKNDLVKANALAFNVTGSRKFGAVINLEPYVGVGVDSFELEAEYDIGQDERLQVKLDRENDLHLTVGGNVNLPVVKANVEFNVAAETSVAGGLSFGI